jgi:predicted P-loop ATPase
VIEDAVHLRKAGFALHWLLPRSKKPVGVDGRGGGWSTAPVATLAELQRSYRDGYNLGIRLGEPSLTPAGYLYLIDIDIRLPDEAEDAWAAFAGLFPDVDPATLPSVISGSGGESRHLYFVSDKAFSGKKLAVSENKHKRLDATKGEHVWSCNWEIDLFGTDRQAVMPPSVHPDTGALYEWERPFDLDLLDLGIGPSIPAAVIDALGIAEATTYAFEAAPAAEFKQGQLAQVLQAIPVERLDSRDDWVMLGQALHHQFGGSDEGFDLWMEHSARSSKFLHKSNRKQELRRYRGFGRNRKKPVTMRSVVDWVADIIRDERTAALAAEFDDLDDAYDEDDDGDPFADLLGGDAAPAASNDPFDDNSKVNQDLLKDAADTNWISLLDLVPDTGAIKPTLHNVELVVKNDPRLVSLPQMNLFTQETVQRTSPGSKANRRRNAAKATRQLGSRIWEVKDSINGDIWSSARDYAIRSILEAPKSQGGYSLKLTDRDLKAATVLAAWDNAFHPIQEYLSTVTWDGRERVDTLFIDYLGADDGPYARQVSRLMLVAAVVRVFEPGHKWDTAIILEGLQGLGKSTFIRTLGKHWSTELEGDFHDGKEMVEKMQGAWVIEMPELSGFNRSDVLSIKAFISRQSDKVRLAYEARAIEFPRQSILIGSTNDREYLKDPTGGRRFLPMRCEVGMIDIASLKVNVDQIWAEAYAIYRQMRNEQPQGTLPLYLTDPVAAAEAARLQESRRQESPDDVLAGQISEWLDRPINNGGYDDDPSGKPRYRNETCSLEVWVELLDGDKRSFKVTEQGMVNRALARVPGWDADGQMRFERWGKQRVFRRGGETGKLTRAGFGKLV